MFDPRVVKQTEQTRLGSAFSNVHAPQPQTPLEVVEGEEKEKEGRGEEGEEGEGQGE